jgi:hypothetical protein
VPIVKSKRKTKQVLNLVFVVISHFFARAFYHVSAFFFSKKVIAQFIKNTMQRYNQHVNAICVFLGEISPKI